MCARSATTGPVEWRAPNRVRMPTPAGKARLSCAARAALDGAVGELVVVAGSERSVLFGQRQARAPAGEKCSRGAGLPSRPGTNMAGRWVEEGVGPVHVVGPYGQLEAAQPVRDAHRPRALAAHPPGVLVDLLQRKLAALAPGGHLVHVALVLAHQVAAGRPDRHADVQRGHAARLDLQLHLDAPRLGCGIRMVYAFMARAL